MVGPLGNQLPLQVLQPEGGLLLQLLDLQLQVGALRVLYLQRRPRLVQLVLFLVQLVVCLLQVPPLSVGLARLQSEALLQVVAGVLELRGALLQLLNLGAQCADLLALGLVLQPLALLQLRLQLGHPLLQLLVQRLQLAHLAHQVALLRHLDRQLPLQLEVLRLRLRQLGLPLAGESLLLGLSFGQRLFQPLLIVLLHLLEVLRVPMVKSLLSGQGSLRGLLLQL